MVVAAASKKPAVKSKKVKDANHPPYYEMIADAIKSLKDRKGSSRQAIIKYIRANNNVLDNAETCVKMALKRNVASHRIVQTTGSGASGSFKLPVTEATKKPVKKVTSVKKTVKKIKETPAKKVVKKSSMKKKAVTPKKKAATPKKKSTPKKKTATKKKSSKKGKK